jgi:hypothetical protein
MADSLTPFDFIKAASHNKADLIGSADYPEMIEKQYNAYIVNRGFSYFQDTILHSNEMNQRAHLFDAAQFNYYRGALRPSNRFTKWHKAEKNTDLDAIQEVYQCSRSIAKMYLKALTPDQMKEVHSKLSKGG